MNQQPRLFFFSQFVLELLFFNIIAGKECQFSNYEDSLLPKINQYSEDSDLLQIVPNQIGKVRGFGFWSFNIPLMDNIISQHIYEPFQKSEKQDGQLLFIIQKVESKEIISVGYESFDFEAREVHHVVNLYNNNELQNSVSFKFSALQYEGKWIFHLITFEQEETDVESFNIQITQNEKKKIKSDSYFNYKIFLGGNCYLINLNLNLDIFKGRISKIIPIQNGYDTFVDYVQKCSIPEKLSGQQTITIVDGLKIFSGNSLYSQYFQHYGFSYYISGWIKYQRVNTKKDYYTLLRLSGFQHYENKQKLGDDLFVFEVELVNYMPSQSRIILTADTYSIPFAQSFQEQYDKTFQINNNQYQVFQTQKIIENHDNNYIYDGLIQWHFIKYEFLDNQKQNKLHYIIYFFNELGQQEGYLGNDIFQGSFTNSMFYCTFGGDNFNQNFFQGEISDLKISYFYQNSQMQDDILICDKTCLTCDGPQKTNCLTCKENQNRYYLDGLKICKCFDDFYELQNGDCLGLANLFPFILLEPFESMYENKCQFGYFRLPNIDDNSYDCKKCPQHLDENGLSCIDCALQSQTWYLEPVCKRDFIRLNTNEHTPYFIKLRAVTQNEVYLIGNDREIQLYSEFQDFCHNDQSGFCLNIPLVHLQQTVNLQCKIGTYPLLQTNVPRCFDFYDIFCTYIEVPQSSCHQCINGYYTKGQHCIKCLSPCIQCFYESSQRQIFCSSCVEQYGLINYKCKQCGLNCAICTQQHNDFLKEDYLRCLKCIDDSKYYISLDGVNCLINSILNCQYSFEVHQSDFSINSFDINFQVQANKNNFRQICAACQLNNMFIFEESFCVQIKNNECDYGIGLFNSITNQYELQECLISSDVVSKISQIQFAKDCSLFIDNCKSCLQTDFLNQYICLECKLGYYASKLKGICIECPSNLFCDICIEQDKKIQNHWKNQIRAFYRRFIENIDGHSFNVNALSQNQEDYEIKCLVCQQGYRLQNSICIQYCFEDCAECIFQDEEFHCVKCHPTRQNFYPLSLHNNQCVECAENCKLCSPRTQEEINKINPLFNSETFKKYSNQCFIPINSDQVIYDESMGLFFNCDLNNKKYCSKQITIELNLFTSKQEFESELKTIQDPQQKIKFQQSKILFSELFGGGDSFLQFQNDQFYQIANQLGVQKFILKISSHSKKYKFSTGVSNTIQQRFSEKIFTLKEVELEIYFMKGDIINGANNMYFVNFKKIMIQNLSFDLSYPNLFFQSLYEQEIILKQITETSQKYPMSIYNFQDVKILNIDGVRIIKEWIYMPYIFKIQSNLVNPQITIKNIDIQVTEITNTFLFYFFINPGVTITIQNVSIQSTLINSSFIQSNKQIHFLYLDDLLIFKSRVNFTNEFLDLSLTDNTIVNNLKLVDSFITNSSLINTYNQIILQNIHLSNCSLVGNSEIIHNSASNNQIINTTIINISFVEIQYNNIVKFIHLQKNLTTLSQLFVKNITLKNNYLFNLSTKYNQYLETTSMILIELDSVVIQDYKIERGPGFIDFFFKNVQNLQLLEGFITQTKYFFKGIHDDINCQLQYSQGKFYPPSIFIFSVENLQVQNLILSKVQVYDLAIFSYYSAIINEEIKKQTLEFSGIEIKENVLLQTESVSLIGLISFMCYQETKITFFNSTFSKNIFQMYEQSLEENSAGLITIGGQTNIINFTSCSFEQNFVINGSSSILYLSGQKLTIQNCLFLNNSIFIYEVLQPNLIWGFEDLQNIFVETIRDLFQVQSKAGIAVINANNVFMNENIFSTSSGYKGGCFNIRSNNETLIQILNCQFYSIFTSFQHLIENGGIFYFEFASNFQMQIEMQNIVVNNVYCRSQGGFMYIASSSNAIISLYNISFIDVYSEIGSIIFSTFQPDESMNTQFLVQSISFQNSLQGYLNYLNFYKTTINVDLLSNLINNRTLVYLENCELIKMSMVFILNLTYESVINIKNSTSMILRDVKVFNSTLVNSLIAYSPSENKVASVYFSNIQIQNIEINFAFDNLTCYEPTQNLTQDKFICPQQGIMAPNTLSFQFIDTEQLYAKCLLMRMFQLLDISQTGLIQLKSLNSNCQIKVLNTFLNLINCEICSRGVIFIAFDTNQISLIQKISSLSIFNSNCGKLGCLLFSKINSQSNRFLSASYNIKTFYELIIINYQCQNNIANYGTCLYLNYIKSFILGSYFIQNTAIQTGGAVYVEGQENFLIYNTVIEKNAAEISGGIYLKNQSPLEFLKLDTFILNNQASYFGNNVVSKPQSLTLLFLMKQIETFSFKKKSDEVIDIISLKNYSTIYGYSSEFLIIPTGQALGLYQYFDQKNRIYINSNLTLRLVALGADQKIIKDLENTFCQIRSRQISNDYQDQEFTNNFTSIKQIQYDQNTQSYNLDNLIVYFDNNITQSNYLQIEFQCSSIQIPIYSEEYPYEILQTHSNYKLRANFRTYQCQFGEIKNLENFACEKCDQSLGMFSLILNQQKCIVIDEISTISVLNNKLNLRPTYWRPYFDTSDINFCLNLPTNCLGGWVEGDSSCYQGHIGALCEQCDIYNIRGEGRFSLSERFSCSSCQDQKKNTIFITITVIFTFIFLFISVQGNLKNIEENHRFKPLFYSTLSPYVTKTQSSILMKMLTNYLQIVASITTFQLQFPNGLQSTINAVGNPIQSSAFSLDCFLVDLFKYPIQYGRIIWQLILPFFYVNLFLFIFILTTQFQMLNFNSSVITTTLIYMFIYFQPNLMGGFIQLISYRKISGFQWIQANVAERYDTPQHFLWVIRFCLPMIIIITTIIPVFLFSGLYRNRKNLEKRTSRLNWGYLYNEYKIAAYYWELIKIIQKALIILSLNYYQDTIVIKGILVLFITYLYQELNRNFLPYYLFSLNKLDYYSANICMITFSLAIGAYISQASNILELKIPFFVLMILFNFYFLQLILSKIVAEYLKSYEASIDKLRDKMRELLPNLNSGYLARIFKNRGQQRKVVQERFQRINKILIPIIKSMLQTKKQNIENFKSLPSVKFLSKDIPSMKTLENETNQNLLKVLNEP